MASLTLSLAAVSCSLLARSALPSPRAARTPAHAHRNSSDRMRLSARTSSTPVPVDKKEGGGSGTHAQSHAKPPPPCGSPGRTGRRHWGAAAGHKHVPSSNTGGGGGTVRSPDSQARGWGKAAAANGGGRRAQACSVSHTPAAPGTSLASPALSSASMKGAEDSGIPNGGAAGRRSEGAEASVLGMGKVRSVLREKRGRGKGVGEEVAGTKGKEKWGIRSKNSRERTGSGL
eukprot:scaffold18477_cov72-Isochrysis_galbana.AAC.1